MDITSLTSLPTDSLYKFMAVAGLLLVFISIAFPIYFRKTLSFSLFDIEKKLAVLRLRSRNLGVDIDQVFRNRVRKDEKVDEQNFSEIELQLDLQKAKIADMRKAQSEQLIETIELNYEVKKLEFISEQLSVLRNVQAAGLFLGAALTISGFYFWYTKIQVYVDDALALPVISASSSQQSAISSVK